MLKKAFRAILYSCLNVKKQPSSNKTTYSILHASLFSISKVCSHFFLRLGLLMAMYSRYFLVSTQLKESGLAMQP